MKESQTKRGWDKWSANYDEAEVERGIAAIDDDAGVVIEVAWRGKGPSRVRFYYECGQACCAVEHKTLRRARWHRRWIAMKRACMLLLVWLLCQVGQLLVSLRMLWSIFSNPDKAWLIAVAIDDAGNVAGNGSIGQTISSRAAQARQAGRKWGCFLCKVLDVAQPGHCAKALTDPEQNLKEV